MRKAGFTGLEGLVPCPQKKGNLKFYGEFDSPRKILNDGTYRHVPLLAGTNSYEGTYIYSSKCGTTVRSKWCHIKGSTTRFIWFHWQSTVVIVNNGIIIGNDILVSITTEEVTLVLVDIDLIAVVNEIGITDRQE